MTEETGISEKEQQEAMEKLFAFVMKQMKDGADKSTITQKLVEMGIDKRWDKNITRGDIKRIQERSRKITDGKFSISEKKAISVLKGDIKLLEAIESDKHNKKPKHL